MGFGLCTNSQNQAKNNGEATNSEQISPVKVTSGYKCVNVFRNDITAVAATATKNERVA